MQRKAADEATDRERASRLAADRHRQRAEESFEQIMGAVEGIFKGLGDAKLQNAQLEEVRNALLVHVLPLYERLAAHDPQDPDSVFQALRAILQIGEIEMILGRRDQARDNFDRARSLGEGLVSQFPTDPRYARYLALANYSLGGVLNQQRPADARAALRRAAGGWESMPDASLTESDLNYLATAHRLLGGIAADAGQPNEAAGWYEKAAAVRARIAAAHVGHAINLAQDCDHQAQAHSKAGNWEAAVAAYRRAVAAWDQVPRGSPDRAGQLRLIAEAQTALGRVLTRLARHEEAVEAFDGAEQAWVEKAGPNPSDRERRMADEHIAAARAFKGEAFARLNRMADADRLYREAIGIWEGLTRVPPTKGRMVSWGTADTKVVVYLPCPELEIGTLSFTLGQWAARAGESAKAADAFRAASDAYRRSVDTGGPFSWNAYAWFLVTCPDERLRDPAEAVRLVTKALDLAKIGVPDAQRGAWTNTLGVAQYRVGDYEAAVEALGQSMELTGGGDGSDYFFLAMAHWRSGNKVEARQWYDKAISWMGKNDPEDEELARFRAEATQLLGIKDAPPSREPTAPKE